MNVKPSDVELLLSLFKIVAEGKAAIDAIRTGSPEAYAHVAANHADAIAAAKMELES